MAQNDTSLARFPLYLAAFAAPLALAVYAFDIEPYWIETTYPVLIVPRLPTALDGMTILLLSDTHLQKWSRREDSLLEILSALSQPDMVVWAGDMVQWNRGIPLVGRLCRAVHSLFSCPNYAIMGNAEHKLRWYKRRELIDDLRSAGLTVLMNEHEPLTLRGETITVAGTDDPYYGHADLVRTLAGAPKNRFTLLLSHSPQIARQAARAGVDVLLSGHTHGGQVRVPLKGALRTQNPLSPKMDCGIFDHKRLTELLGEDPGGNLITYISRGIGVAPVYRFELYPRFLCRPEVALLTLRGERDNNF